VTDNLKKIRWQQRFQNFDKAFTELTSAVNQKKLSKLERSGLIKTFEFSFELAWKSLKDFLESEGIDAATPREVIKQGFQKGFIEEGELWLDALEKRNLLTHTYDEVLAKKAELLIRDIFFQLLVKFHNQFKEKL
jgi:nucleotidyltransferase substrate binding protein (TIGR01987 family)